MGEAAAGQGGVVVLDVDLDLMLQAVGLEEAEHRRGVAVVLVLGRLVGLGLDQDGPLEADPVLVLHHQAQEAAELVQLLAQVGVQDGVVALAAAPQHIVGAAEPVGRLDHLAHLQGGPGGDLGIGIGGRAGHVAAVAEQVGGAPEQLHPGARLMARQHVDGAVQVGDVLAGRGRVGHHVHVVEGVERRAQLLEKGEGVQGLELGQLLGGRRSRLPRAVEHPLAEDVGARPGKAVPVADRHAQVLGEGLAQHHAARVVVAEGQRVVRARTLIADLVEGFEDVLGHGSFGLRRRTGVSGSGRGA